MVGVYVGLWVLVNLLVLAPELPEALPEVEQATTEPLYLRPPISLQALVLGQGHGDDEFPRELTRNLGVSERMGTVCSQTPA